MSWIWANWWWSWKETWTFETDGIKTYKGFFWKWRWQDTVNVSMSLTWKEGQQSKVWILITHSALTLMYEIFMHVFSVLFVMYIILTVVMMLNAYILLNNILVFEWYFYAAPFFCCKYVFAGNFVPRFNTMCQGDLWFFQVFWYVSLSWCHICHLKNSTTYMFISVCTDTNNLWVISVCTPLNHEIWYS